MQVFIIIIINMDIQISLWISWLILYTLKLMII
jgi:hypothetical protein